ncbi:hypothetical protein D3C76_1339960 [compost metagenome]
MTSDKPLVTIIIARVAMKGGMFIFATIKPLTKPHSAPARIPPTMPNGTGRPQKVIMTPTITDENVITVPRARSMPPVIITKVAPSANTPITAVETRIPTRFEN